MRIAKCLLLLVLLSCASLLARAQFLMDMIDTTTDLGKGMISMYHKYDALRFSGYIQPQFQLAEAKGIETYAAGNFGTRVNNRFLLRRGRIRVDYERYNKDDMPVIKFAFQFDGTERGVAIRDFYGRFFETKFNLFSLAAGMFARPFGYEVNLSSADRETPERGRMSQILMRTERDLGAMVSFEPRRKGHPLSFLKIDAGLFNGQGLTSTADFDSHKDFIGRIGIKPQRIKGTNYIVSGGVSVLYGGMEQFTQYINRMGTVNDKPGFVVDSAVTNAGEIAPRHYYGADIQFRIPNGRGKGSTQFRAEYIRGTQTATASTTETPGSIPMTAQGRPQPLYIRKFDGAYLYFIQHLGSEKHQAVVKYDWYDPNKAVKGKEIGAPGTRLTAADIRYNTLGIGYLYYANEHLKFMFYYDWVQNEATELEGYQDDRKDNVLTCRVQYRF
ncbi:porin [Chitinophaga nivalis]|uniref:Porin n=1 Tax=Chitinophaga nivalis TaxID=2991709 RepID=A0ABT3IWM2_9BACT|nr:porin [Chitinophaga nivalis]MCW3461923.1 porin [Chitinophaga nivalis]MCW3488386.1 porin [Chitinophaga nivalis]